MGHGNQEFFGHREEIAAAFSTLCAAYEYALDTNSRPWDFAVSIRTLFKVGANESDLRWLVRKGIVVHAKEVTIEGDDGRDFRPTGDLTFALRTCFILTEEGYETVKSPSRACLSLATDEVGSGRVNQPEKCVQVMPHWDLASRRLQVNGHVVKRFKWPASNQEAVLCAFQEEGWPARIDDPLPPHADQDSKRRLADTIKCLNRKQENFLLHFHGDGTGEGVTWEYVKEHT